MSNVKFNLKFIFSLILLVSLTNSNGIVSNLWSLQYVGEPNSLKFINSKEFLISSNRGIIQKLNLNGEIEWKKNLIYKTDLELDTLLDCNFN